MRAWRALRRALLGRLPDQEVHVHPGAPAVPWGQIGTYEAVSRDGILLLLAPEAGHPSLRVKPGADPPAGGGVPRRIIAPQRVSRYGCLP